MKLAYSRLVHGLSIAVAQYYLLRLADVGNRRKTETFSTLTGLSTVMFIALRLLHSDLVPPHGALPSQRSLFVCTEMRRVPAQLSSSRPRMIQQHCSRQPGPPARRDLYLTLPTDLRDQEQELLPVVNSSSARWRWRHVRRNLQGSPASAPYGGRARRRRGRLGFGSGSLRV